MGSRPTLQLEISNCHRGRANPSIGQLPSQIAQLPHGCCTAMCVHNTRLAIADQASSRAFTTNGRCSWQRASSLMQQTKVKTGLHLANIPAKRDAAMLCKNTCLLKARHRHLSEDSVRVVPVKRRLRQSVKFPARSLHHQAASCSRSAAASRATGTTSTTTTMPYSKCGCGTC